jgi:ATP-dependent Clp protease adaptor protein ClpS
MTHRRPSPHLRFQFPPYEFPARNPNPVRHYNIVLHRAANVAMLAIYAAVKQLTHYAEHEARTRMWEVEQDGRSVVLKTHLERAELYAEQFAELGLSVSVEPAG